MHEWLITRGDVRGAPFEIQVQIQVPVNVVLCHEGICHQKLQFGEQGMYICFSHIRLFHEIGEVIYWLVCLRPYLSIVEEKLRWVNGYLDSFGYPDISNSYTA